MGPTAHVTESDALSIFRAMLCTFTKEAKDALAIIDHEIQRTFSFLDEKMHVWQAEVRHAEDAVIQAKIELKQLEQQRIGDRKPDTTFQEKLLRRAQARLEFAEEKLTATKRWQRDLPHELLDYQGPARQLQNALEGEVPRMIALLERKIATLEAYMQGNPT
jgi:DNA repair exonuclease SbcCD ATPase subunit